MSIRELLQSYDFNNGIDLVIFISEDIHTKLYLDNKKTFDDSYQLTILDKSIKEWKAIDFNTLEIYLK
jgi:hypothetical protein